jgi:homoserine kinase
MTTIRVKAPASTANLGPGFDCAAAALDLWNELVVAERVNGDPWVEIAGEGAGELPVDGAHLALRAFARYTRPGRYRFSFVNRIPLERGLGSSAAAVACGLVAGAAAAGATPDPDDALAAGAELEGHTDNLAAVLRGGVCLSWGDGDRPVAVRVASDLPFTPVVVLPGERTRTSESRSALPRSVAHADAAASAGRAALLGAALAAEDGALFRSAVAGDRLHEPFRARHAPLLVELRRGLPDGAAGVTLSGSGPSVVVWAEKERAAEVAAALRRRLAGRADVLELAVAAGGAEAS